MIENLIEMPPRSVCSADVCMCAPCLFLIVVRLVYLSIGRFGVTTKSSVIWSKLKDLRGALFVPFSKNILPQDVSPRCVQMMQSQSKIVSTDVFRRF